jgi:hypothetical protein
MGDVSCMGRVYRAAMKDPIDPHAPVPCFCYGRFTPGFVDNLSTRLRGLRVLEVFAGNGYLAAALAARGVAIRATSLRSSHDGHEYGLHHPVEELDAVEAVLRHGGEADVLLMSWPTTTVAATVAALEWGADRPVAWIGEMTRHDLGRAGLGGCATDLFFEVSVVDADLPGYEPRGRLDRAAMLSMRPECVARWREGCRDAGALAAPADAMPAP